MTFRIGAHVSISGGVPKAVEREVDLGGNCGQIFVGSPRGWAVSDVDPTEAEAFREAAADADVGPWIVHGTYLVNFATPKPDLAAKSVETVQAELDATAELGIDYYTFHPGSHTGAGVDDGVDNVATRLSKLGVPDGVTLLLENTAGKGTSLGKTVDQLARMIDGSDHGDESLGLCLDTCHLYAAGYEFTADGLDALAAEVDDAVGLESVDYLHLNDSKHPLGSEKDEHEHIGEGAIGDAGFERFVNHDAFADAPMVLETPEDDKGYAWNVEKVRSLRS
ncbi:deoxyribonuclease IV [Haloplanus sp. GCM10025708]|uniref:deoxyribonuclease IV n=1 Tax=Haloferacaceae TaxID=1644056 RepID=UPI003615DD45